MGEGVTGLFEPMLAAAGPAVLSQVADQARTGARELCTRIASSSARQVLYVSCDTPTLARDLALLAPSFAPRAIEAFELFPQTSHVETVVHLERRRP